MSFKFLRNTVNLLIVSGIIFISCRKEDQVNSNQAYKLRLSATAVSFDTLFTSTISTLRKISLYNDNLQALEISSIRLKGNASGNSYYSFSAGGKPGPVLTNLKLAGRDSITLYLKVQIPANKLIIPFPVQDSILIITNGNHQGIALASYGQNVNFINDTLIQNDTHWNAILPYVINHQLTVAAGASLRIDAGSQIYFHGQSGLKIQGTLIVNGEVNFPVSLGPDRLETAYNSLPGQWQGILITAGSINNSINYAQIINAETGIAVISGQRPQNQQAIISNTTISNMSYDGISGKNTSLKLLNNIVSFCQNSLLDLTGDSYLTAKQNTFYNSNQFFFHTAPGISVNLTGAADSILFINNIVYGTLPNELVLTGARSIAVKGNLLTSGQSSSYPLNVFNAEPLFRLPAENDFHLRGTASPAYAKGISLTGDSDSAILVTDQDGIKRKNPPTVGAYEVN